MQEDKNLRYYKHIKRHKKYEGKNKIKVRKRVSFDPGSSTLRLAFCWPPSIGVGSSQVMSFDWDFGRGEVPSFD